MLAPLRCHWYRSGGVPDARTLNVTGAPGATVRLAGCVVMLGAARPVDSIDDAGRRADPRAR